MMKINRKWAAIGVALSLGAVFWMREMASWRPVMVAKVEFAPTQLKFSRDGQFLRVKNFKEGMILNLQNGAVDSKPEHTSNFDKNYSLETYPRLWNSGPPHFTTYFASGENTKPLVMPNTSLGLGSVNFCFLPKQEIFCAWDDEIYIVSMKSGQVKRRVPCADLSPSSLYPDSSAFSPDGKWLLSAQLADPNSSTPTVVDRLRRFDVQSGKMMPLPDYSGKAELLHFSPDGRTLLVADALCETVTFFETSKWKQLFSVNATGPVKWLPDGRVGILQNDGFEWRDASGHLLRRLRGPFQSFQATTGVPKVVTDWALSPDGNWIYTCEGDGTIRKWRAR